MREVLLNNRGLRCNFLFLAMRQVMGTINQEKPQVGVLFRALKLIELKPSKCIPLLAIKPSEKYISNALRSCVTLIMVL